MEKKLVNPDQLKQKNLLHIQDVYKYYGDKLVLNDIDFSVAHRELCTVVGPSGCGKSTLLRLVLGQEHPTTGQIFIDNKPIGVTDKTRGIVYQKYSLYPHLTVLENVALGLCLNCGFIEEVRTRHKIKKEARYFLDRVGLASHEAKYPHELSGGMQQRVAIAQAMITRPKILMMDEPFGALDPGTRESMQLFLLEVWEEFKMTVFFVTHDLEEALFLGTRVVVLSQYYSEGEGKDRKKGQGAKIVADYNLDKEAKSSAIKKNKDFVNLIYQIRREGFDPEHLQYISEFNLKHPDSFQTI
ncbi:MAG: ABC transporter ATP-binding protein [Deltaproteobacteria bacterium]|nr:ABC transporter ATP-binding protein [Deltaproteobacteria bacterium]